YGPRSQSAALFATLASLPVVSLPGRGLQPVQPIHVYELAEIVARAIEAPRMTNAVHELGGPQPLAYREMLAQYRQALGLGAALPQPSGVLTLLARCGFDGDAGIAALVFSCALNITLGALTLRRPTPWLYALQVGAVLGYTLVAAIHMPQLTIDHCGPLVKNL